MEAQEPIEHTLIKDAALLEFDVVDTSIRPTVGNEDYHVVIAMKTEDDLLEKAALGLMFSLAMLSFHDARPRGVSGQWFEDEDQLSIADFLRSFEYCAGVLRYYGDYLRGRCLKTTIEVYPDGSIKLETVNRGEAATRWIDRIRGKKLLQAV
jgi:hypothetical protein